MPNAAEKISANLLTVDSNAEPYSQSGSGSRRATAVRIRTQKLATELKVTLYNGADIDKNG
jgi:hypothetical protein